MPQTEEEAEQEYMTSVESVKAFIKSKCDETRRNPLFTTNKHHQSVPTIFKLVVQRRDYSSDAVEEYLNRFIRSSTVYRAGTETVRKPSKGKNVDFTEVY